MGRMIIGLLQAMFPGRVRSEDVNLQSAAAVSVMGLLRRRLAIALYSMLCMILVCVMLLVQGVTTYVNFDSNNCPDSQRLWLLGFLVMQFFWPICMPQLTLLLLVWCAGALVLIREPPLCDPLRQFAIEALVLEMSQCVLLIMAAIAALAARPLWQQMGELLSQRGTDPEVIQHIEVLQTSQVPLDEECAICLSREEDGVLWRRPACGHCFHEPCLLEWLAKATRCPVCRLDLQQAYRPPTGPGPPPSAAAEP